MNKPDRYLMIEAPSKSVTVDFLGKYGVQVKLELEGDKLRVYVQACDDRGTILQDEELEVPEADDRT